MLIPKCLRTYGAPFESKYRAIFQVPRVVPPPNFVLHMLLLHVDNAQQVLTLLFAHMPDYEVVQLATTCREDDDVSHMAWEGLMVTDPCMKQLLLIIQISVPVAFFKFKASK